MDSNPPGFDYMPSQTYEGLGRREQDSPRNRGETARGWLSGLF